jgi:hypothetical protein
MRASIATLTLALGLAVTQSGCIKAMLTNGQIESTRKGAVALDSVGDYEMAGKAASAGLAQFEGMHVLAPDNEDALFLLTKGWAGYGFGFVEDERDTASLAGDDDTADYHKKRARLAYDRAIFYGVELLGHRASGFDDARKNEATMKAWLDRHFTDKDDAETLFWLGYAWLARANVSKDDPSLVGELFVGVAMLERSFALDPDYNHRTTEIALAAYHARTAMSEMDQSKQMFEEAIAKTEGKSLMAKLNYATRYACVKGDKALYDRLLAEVLSAEDPDPSQRLTNTIAKRRAKRATSKAAMDDCGF